jgi:hypothetical protein
MAPASRLLKPATRVYSSPNPTQPDSSTIGDASSIPQKLTARDGVADDGVDGGREVSATGASMGRLSPIGTAIA